MIACDHYNPRGFLYTSAQYGREILLAHGTPWEGWLCYRQGSEWITLKKADDVDRQEIREAIQKAGYKQ